MSTRGRTDPLKAALVAGLVALPLADALAADPGQASKAAPGGQKTVDARAAVLRGRVTDEAGAPLADVRVRVSIPATNMLHVNASIPHELRETRSDARGDYRLELPGITERATVSIDALKPGFLRLAQFPRGGLYLEVGPGEQAEAPLVLRPALYVSGIVVDERGRPVPAVSIVAEFVAPRGGYRVVERTASHPDGSFEVFNYPVGPARRNPTSKGTVSFFHPDYVETKIEDVYAMAPEGRTGLRIVLPTGYKLAGTVLDAAGKPVPKAMVKAVLKDGTHRKATTTGERGRFALRGLSPGLTLFSARAMEIRQKLNLPMAVNADRTDLEVRLKPIPLPADLPRYDVLGMQLADVTPELISAYDLFWERGVFILDPGQRIDRIAEGHVMFGVGNKGVGNVREFIAQILAQTAGRDAEEYSVLVRHTFSTVEMDGTTSERLRLTKDDLKQLQAVSDRLAPESP
jgi:protocatechuate 3,4-dioxygenase beta subunit